MILRFLDNTWTLIAVWVVGPAILFAMYRRNRKRAAAAGGPRPAATPAAEGGAGRSDREATPPPSTRRDVAPGFRGLAWGDPPAADMALVSQEGDEAMYTREGDPLRVEDVDVEAIHYVFRGGAFAAVRVDAPFHAGDPLLRALAKQWGPADTADPRALKQQWANLVAGPMATAALLEKNPVSRRTTLFLFRKAEKRPVA